MNNEGHRVKYIDGLTRLQIATGHTLDEKRLQVYLNVIIPEVSIHSFMLGIKKLMGKWEGDKFPLPRQIINACPDQYSTQSFFEERQRQLSSDPMDKCFNGDKEAMMKYWLKHVEQLHEDGKGDFTWLINAIMKADGKSSEDFICPVPVEDATQEGIPF